MKARYLLLVIVLFAMFPTALVEVCKTVVRTIIQLVANLAGVST